MPTKKCLIAGTYNSDVVFARAPKPGDEPLMPGVRRYYRRLFGGGMVLCLTGIVAGILIQRTHYRGDLGLVMSIVSGMLGAFCAFCLWTERDE